MDSRVPGIFNLGGDLSRFAEKMRASDLHALRRYGPLGGEAIHGNSEAFKAPVVKIVLVQGDALGGGFECALAFDVIVPERSAKFGLPGSCSTCSPAWAPIPSCRAASGRSRRSG